MNTPTVHNVMISGDGVSFSAPVVTDQFGRQPTLSQADGAFLQQVPLTPDHSNAEALTWIAIHAQGGVVLQNRYSGLILCEEGGQVRQRGVPHEDGLIPAKEAGDGTFDITLQGRPLKLVPACTVGGAERRGVIRLGTPSVPDDGMDVAQYATKVASILANAIPKVGTAVSAGITFITRIFDPGPDVEEMRFDALTRMVQEVAHQLGERIDRDFRQDALEDAVDALRNIKATRLRRWCEDRRFPTAGASPEADYTRLLDLAIDYEAAMRGLTRPEVQAHAAKLYVAAATEHLAILQQLAVLGQQLGGNYEAKALVEVRVAAEEHSQSIQRLIERALARRLSLVLALPWRPVSRDRLATQVDWCAFPHGQPDNPASVERFWQTPFQPLKIIGPFAAISDARMRWHWVDWGASDRLVRDQLHPYIGNLSGDAGRGGVGYFGSEMTLRPSWIDAIPSRDAPNSATRKLPLGAYCQFVVQRMVADLGPHLFEDSEDWMVRLSPLTAWQGPTPIPAPRFVGFDGYRKAPETILQPGARSSAANAAAPVHTISIKAVLTLDDVRKRFASQP